MKVTFTLIWLSIYFGSSMAQLPSTGLVAHYDFNLDKKKDSARIFDISGNRNHGSIIGTVDYSPDRYGVACSALYFDGSSYVTIPDSRSLRAPQSELSIVVWFKLAQDAHLFNQWITICCKSDQSVETADSPQYRMQATAQTVSLNTAFTEKVVPLLDYEVWYFYVYTFDGRNVRVYLNGTLIYQHQYNGAFMPNYFPLEIGRDKPGKEEYYYGAMDDLRIYNRSLSQTELDMLYMDRSEANDSNRCMVTSLEEDPLENSGRRSQPPHLPSTSDTVRQNNPNPPNIVPNLPDSILDTPIEYQKTIEVQNKEITIYPYDSKKEDRDTVSININGVWVRDYIEIKKRRKNPPTDVLIKCSLNPGSQNYLVSKAWNVGLLPPNTLTVEINDGTSVQRVSIDSDIGISGGIKIVCNEE